MVDLGAGSIAGNGFTCRAVSRGAVGAPCSPPSVRAWSMVSGNRVGGMGYSSWGRGGAGVGGRVEQAVEHGASWVRSDAEPELAGDVYAPR